MTIKRKSSKDKSSITLDVLHNLEKQFLEYDSAPCVFNKGAVAAEYKKHCKKNIRPKQLTKKEEDFLYAAYMQWIVNKDEDALLRLDEALYSLHEAVILNYVKEDCKSLDDLENTLTCGGAIDLLDNMMESMQLIPPVIHDGILDYDDYKENHGFNVDLNNSSLFAVPPSFSYLIARVTTAAIVNNKNNLLEELRDCVPEMVTAASYPLWEGYEKKYNSKNSLPDILTSILLSPFSPNGFDYESDPLIYGMPGAVAYRIANSFYYGDGIKSDKEIAKFWFSYGAGVGDVKCLMAYVLYYCQANLDAEETVYCSANNVGFLLTLAFIDAFSLYLYAETAKILCISKDQAKNDKYVVNTLFNLLSYSNEMMGAHGFTSNPYKYLDDIFTSFLEVFQYIINFTKYDDRLISAMAYFLELIRSQYINGITNVDKFVKQLLNAVGMKDYKKKDLKEKLISLAEHGVKKGDLYSHVAYLDMCSLNKIPLSDLNKKYLEFLSDSGYAEITYIIGNSKLKGSDASKALPYWKKSAEDGDGYAMFNCGLNCLVHGDNKMAIEYATKAINYGIVQAYYLLYKAYLSTHEALAHTYLRYASEYMFPDAIDEYNTLMIDCEFRPLPYMDAIIELEDLAEYSYEACVVMCDIYSGSCLLPTNLNKSFDYHRRSIELGNSSFYPYYRQMYEQSFPAERDNYKTFMSYRESLRTNNTDFLFFTHQGESESARINELIGKIIDSLIKGKTPLEKEILSGLYKSRFWENVGGYKGRLPRNIDRKSSKCLTFVLKKKLLEGIYCVRRDYILDEQIDDEDKLQNAYTYLKGIEEQGACDSLDSVLAKGFLAVRSFTHKANYSLFKKCMTKAKSAGSATGSAYSKLDFEMLFEGTEDLVSSDCDDKSANIYDPEVFVSPVDQ